MFIEFLTGAGVKLIGNVVTSIFQNSAEKNRAIHLNNSETIEAHIKLAEIHSKDKVVKFERMVVFFMLVGSFCYISIGHLMDTGLESIVLVDREIGFISRFFSHTKQVPMSVSSGTFIFELWCNIMVMILGSYTVPPRK